MSFLDNVKKFFTTDHAVAPEHKVEGGSVKDWKAADFGPEHYVDDEWITNNTKEVQGWVGQERQS